MSAEAELDVRIIVRHPLPGVAFAVQRGRDQLLPPTVSTATALTFEFTVRVGDTPTGTAPRLLGPYTQGPPTERFVYVNAGQTAGQYSSCWTRRAKIPLGGITREMIRAVLSTPGARVETEFEGVGRDGGPTCATVKTIFGDVSA